MLVREDHCWRGCLGLSPSCLLLVASHELSKQRTLYFKCPQGTGTTVLQHNHIPRCQAAGQIYLYTVSFRGQHCFLTKQT